MRPPSAPIDWTAEGAPRSTLFDDIYFQPGEGLAEARAVFLAGCGLPEAWRGRPSFTVAELGFGTGLNILALLDLWRRERAPGQRLHVFSVEGFPLAAEDAARALDAWPELADLAERLLSRWPRQARGFQRIDLPDLDAVVDIAVDEAADALRAWSGRADAWFLDGFSPASNPGMWSAEVLGLVAARSAPGAAAATFTVAGAVRRGLAAAGFSVEKRPGHGRKRERLEARLAGSPDSAPDPGRVAVIGGGVAAAALARALAALGVRALVVSDGQAGASGNPVALVTPALDAGERPGARLSAQAFRRAVDLYGRVPRAILSAGVVQMEAQARDARRFDRIAESGLFAPGEVRRLTPAAVSEQLGEPQGSGGLRFSEGLAVDPDVAVRAWLADADLRVGRVAGVERAADGWRLLDAEGGLLAEADTVILAAGAGARALHPLPLSVIRGQLSWLEGVAAQQAAAWGGYSAPTRDGLAFGATHDRDDEGVDARPQDDARNLAALAIGRPVLARSLAGLPLRSRAALRATTRDRQPLAGRLSDGLYVLGGLGGRGFTLAPLLAEHLAALATGAPSPLPMDLAAILDPCRASLKTS